MRSTETVKRAVLGVDAAGCGAAGLVVLTPLGSAITGSPQVRRGLSCALLASAVTLGRPLRGARITASDLVRAAGLNGLWVASCLVARSRMPQGRARDLVVATAVLDAVAGSLQGALALLSARA